MLNTRRRPEGGFSLALMALFLVALLGMAGLVVDLGAWQVEASRIQQAADAAALAGVVELPDGVAAATVRAIEVAGDNGYVDGSDGVTVTVEPLGDERLEVSVTKDEVSQYFTRVVRGNEPTSITRRSTAQYVQPVPLGSPRNYLGTSDLPIGVTGDGVENFFLAVSGECTRREYGDRITGIAMNNPDSPHSCDPTDGRGTLENPEHRADGYLFGVTVPDVPGAYPVDIQIFDAPTCTSRAVGDEVFGEQATPFDITVNVRAYDPMNPLGPVPLVSESFVGRDDRDGQCEKPSVTADGSCDRTAVGRRECWATLTTLTEPGDYTIQVDPRPPPALDVNTRHAVFSLRAKDTSVFSPCTSDPTEVAGTPAYRPTCTQVHGLEHLPIYAQGNDDATFFLASVDSRHNGKTMQVTLFDAAEGASTISLLDPNGDPAAFTWEVLCANGDQSQGGSCPDEQGLTGARSGVSEGDEETVDVSGTGTQPFTNNVQNGKYSDRLLRLTVQLPSDMVEKYGARTWWKIHYGGDFTGDRTTWSVKLLGDPVRLLPNAPTTTTTTSTP